MRVQDSRLFGGLAKSCTGQIVLFAAVMIGMANLNALVDLLLHPEIPYFDREHVVVGGVTGLVSAVLFGLLFIQVRRLEDARSTIKVLESILPICTNCRRIRKPESESKAMASWLTIEDYITHETDSRFSHGICPECMSKVYPEFRASETEEDNST